MLTQQQYSLSSQLVPSHLSSSSNTQFFNNSSIYPPSQAGGYYSTSVPNLQTCMVNQNVPLNNLYNSSLGPNSECGGIYSSANSSLSRAGGQFLPDVNSIGMGTIFTPKFTRRNSQYFWQINSHSTVINSIITIIIGLIKIKY